MTTTPKTTAPAMRPAAASDAAARPNTASSSGMRARAGSLRFARGAAKSPHTTAAASGAAMASRTASPPWPAVAPQYPRTARAASPW
jgi:hypothetical protein